MLISCVFIIATVAVYAWLPELRNMHGRVLMAYLLCLFFGFLFMASMQIMLTVDNISAVTCVILSKLHCFYAMQMQKITSDLILQHSLVIKTYHVSFVFRPPTDIRVITWLGTKSFGVKYSYYIHSKRDYDCVSTVNS